MTNDAQIEQEIQSLGLNAPRITPDLLEGNIAGEYFFTAAEAVGLPPFSGPDGTRHPLELLTFCVLQTRNGFTVTGESACASPANFNEALGQKIARQEAVNKLWPLMGYELKQRLHEGGA